MTVIGIDLGTTFSAVSTVYDNIPVILPNGSEHIIPSVVGLSPEGEWLIGTPALNQYTLYPERTIRSVKRLMGTDQVITLGEYELTPHEVSGLILREIKAIAEANLGEEVTQAVITVPAYFNNAQRRATTAAGELAGLEVVRIINEPTAAALAFGLGTTTDQTALVYDLGGGTFDVSLVDIVNGVIDVRASHGDTHLGGDDFDARLVDYLLELFAQQHGIDLKGNRQAMARIQRAAEQAKIDLSSRMFTWVREEYLAEKRGVPLHLEVEISREKFVSLIHDLLLRTTESIDRVLEDGEIETVDTVLLVGGSTIIPAVWELVAEQTGVQPRQDVNPSEAVALGAGIQGAIIEGKPIETVLVDVSPHSLGVAVVNFTYAGDPIEDSYKVLIRRNTTIPVTIEEVFSAISPDQSEARIEVYQGDHPVASQNTLLGDFTFDDLPLAQDSEPTQFTVQFTLNMNGMLEVVATERITGRQLGIAVATDHHQLPQFALQGQGSETAIPVAMPDFDDEDEVVETAIVEEAETLLSRAQEVLENTEDVTLQGLVDDLTDALDSGDTERLQPLVDALMNLLYEGSA
jgi:molecular chaperone DnaK